MSNNTEWATFLADVAANNDLTPKFHFYARVTRASVSPAFAYSLPLGEVALYSNYLVFLTRSVNPPGAALPSGYKSSNSNWLAAGFSMSAKSGEPSACSSGIRSKRERLRICSKV